MLSVSMVAPLNLKCSIKNYVRSVLKKFTARQWGKLSLLYVSQ